MLWAPIIVDWQLAVVHFPTQKFEQIELPEKGLAGGPKSQELIVSESLGALI